VLQRNQLSAQPSQEQAGRRLGSEEADIDARMRQRRRAALDRHSNLRTLVVDVDEAVIADRRCGKPFEGKAHLFARRLGSPHDVVKARQVGRVQLAHLVEVGTAIDRRGGQARNGADRGDWHCRASGERQERCSHNRDEDHGPARCGGLGSFPKRRMPEVVGEKVA
jgi:hypothetical protein